jgi:hypothetical protein
MPTRKRQAAKKAAKRRTKSPEEQGIDAARDMFARFLEKADPKARQRSGKTA